jgi:hypothetical protein
LGTVALYAPEVKMLYRLIKVEVRGIPHLAKNERDVGHLRVRGRDGSKKSQALLMNNRTFLRFGERGAPVKSAVAFAAGLGKYTGMGYDLVCF